MIRARMAGTIALVGVVACIDKGSIGEYESSSGAEPDEATASASHSVTSVSTASASDGEVPQRCPDGKGCTNFPQCGEECGQVQSPFDEDGCLRPTCHGDDECSAGERCFVGLDFGYCEPSTMTCEETLDGPDPGCTCGGTLDCNGGHCVPDSLYPAPLEDGDFSVAMLAPSCGPVDEPVLALVYYGDGEFNHCAAANATIELLVAFPRSDELVGEHVTAAGGFAGMHRGESGVEEQVVRARLVIDDVYEDEVGQHAVGSFEAVVIADGALRIVSGEIEDLMLCEQTHTCP